MTRKGLTLLLGLFVSGAAAIATAQPVHVSEFNETVGTSPVTAGDVSRIWAVDGSWPDGNFGHYKYTGDGLLKLSHPAHDWDDPYWEFDLDDASVATTSTMEIQLDLKPEFDPAASFQYVEILVTGANLGHGGGDSRDQADLTLRLRSQAGALTVGFNQGTAAVPYQTLTTTAAELEDFQVIINYDSTTDDWHAFYRINDNVLKEFPNSPVNRVKARNTLRVGCQTWWQGDVKTVWELGADELRIYDGIETTEGEFEVGELLRHSDFNEPAETGDFFRPIGAGDVNSLYVPEPATHDYDGEGTWWVNHPGTQGTNPNANINKVTGPDKSAEWVMHIKPDWSATGNGQMYNFKVDGNDVAFFVGNYTGGSTGTWTILFGEGTDIFEPDPANVAPQHVPADQVTDLILIINYDADLEEFNAYYKVNDLDLQKHPGSPVQRARSGQTGNENQWQAWRETAGAFSVGLHDYKEL